MSRRTAVVVALGALFVATAGVVACSSSDDAKPSGPSPTPDGGVDAPLAEAGRATDPDAAAQYCLGAALTSDLVAETRTGGDTPMAAGGMLVPGSYDLAEMYEYTGNSSSGGTPERDADVDADLDDGGVPEAGPEEPPEPSTLTGRAARRSIEVRKDAFRWVDQRGTLEADGGPETRFGAWYTIKDATLETDPICPPGGQKGTISFTAAPNGLMIVTDAKHAEIYTRRP